MHATTREPPAVRFLAERDHRTPLPRTPLVSAQEPIRTASRDCLVSFAGSRYSVPWVYAGQRLLVRPSQGVGLTVRTLHGEVIATHDLAPTKGMTIIDPAHYVGLRGREPVTRARVIRAFLERFPEAVAFVTGVLAQHPPNGVAHLRAVLRLADLYPTGVMQAAFAAAQTYHSYSHAVVRGVVETQAQTQTQTQTAPAAQRAPASAALSTAAPPSGAHHLRLTADLGVYQAFLEGDR